MRLRNFILTSIFLFLFQNLCFAQFVTIDNYSVNNLGQAQQFINHPNCVAIVYPLGKSAGLSGAFVVGSKMLKQYLINFSRSFIYTTGPSKQLVIQLRKQLETMMKKDTSFIFALK